MRDATEGQKGKLKSLHGTKKVDRKTPNVIQFRTEGIHNNGTSNRWAVRGTRLRNQLHVGLRG